MISEEQAVENFKNSLKDLLDKFGSEMHKDGAFCTTYFITAEFFDGDGQYWASTFYDDKQPIWHTTGLVQHALENDLVVVEEEEQ